MLAVGKSWTWILLSNMQDCTGDYLKKRRRAVIYLALQLGINYKYN